MATQPSIPSASWTSEPGMSNPGFEQFMYQIAQDYANYAPAFGYGPQDVGKLFQELGEGNQGQQLLNMFNSGLTAEQVHQAYYGQFGNIDPGQVSQLTQQGVTPDNLPPALQQAYQSGVLQYIPGQAAQVGGGDTPTDVAATSGYWRLQPPATRFGGTGAAAQPLFSHSSQTGADTGAFGFDPNRGFETSRGNFHSSTFWDQIVPMASMGVLGGTLGAGISSALGGGLLGQIGGSLGKVGLNSLISGQFNPSSLLPTVASALGGALDIPSWLPRLGLTLTQLMQQQGQKSGETGNLSNFVNGGQLASLLPILQSNPNLLPLVQSMVQSQGA